MNRKPIFDAVRAILGRGFTQAEVGAIDRAIDRALEPTDAAPRLGALSARFESGTRGPGTVSSGTGDPGGVSYGLYQLSSRAGTVTAFLGGEGALWQGDFAGLAPGSPAFAAAWQAVAAREPDAFAEAQHAFIERTHYRPVVAAVLRRTGLDLDSRHVAVRDATWSAAVQHGGAAGVLAEAVERVDTAFAREDPTYDRALVEAMYRQRADYVSRVAERSAGSARRLLLSIVAKRYPAEREAALAMFG
ncbi:hypothetical protein [Novosphingobium album (ex Liu et al. 2023)]|uniref:Type VI secretion system spike protein VgrG3-like C-terminal domain-containing protein n=1 Tax=Novosphingobium album (ex Liu et al. 2023) TaxID=3031130 RepID=A0ABT5WJM1_9SPHN|nr:hypothetical protein [Novosphingobium album (ex Liu et al. 2023)]MDE8650244.1 hypothetical protein [Novosphingobium album (ex Liu et al. 2023)]